MTLEEAARALAEAAVNLERATGYPAEVSAAQAAIETGWLKHVPGNNPFGIKSFNRSDGRQLLQTTEWFTEDQLSQFLALGDGRRVVARHPDRDSRGRTKFTVMDWFRSYPSIASAFLEYGQRLTSGRYRAGWESYLQHRDPARLVDDIAKAGYATDPNYAVMLRNIIAGPRLSSAIAEERKKK